MDHKQKLTFVLLCSGNGADSSLYRPNGDDKRYRHRLDALVRCVAVTLFSAAGSSANNTDDRSCELILIYEDCCMKMSLSSHSRKEKQLTASFVQQPPPLEKDIVTAWKQAANEATRKQQQISSIGTMGSSFTRNQKGCNMSSASTPFQLVTKCVLDESPPKQTAAASSKSKNKLPSHMPASKRDAISTLQSSCSLEFLRSHHLNVPLAVALKKFNKNKLQAVWDNANKDDSASVGDSHTQQSDSSKIKRTFRSILSEAKGSDPKNDYSTDVLAAYLHESCDSELPCWSKELSDRNKEAKHIFLFCGAVRDMTEAENASLSNICEEMKIPLLPCRLGPVPEFTSKIICVAGYHYYKGLLGGGLIKLWERKQNQTQSHEMMNTTQHPSKDTIHKNLLHTIALVPIDANSLTADPSKRCRVHWCMVRLCVCSLYRSKFASTTRDALDNKLSFILQDGFTINLDQRDFISSLAEKHQAAPSERQILEELCRRRDNALSQEECDGVNQVLSPYIYQNDHPGDVFALDFSDDLHNASKQVMELAYAGDEYGSSGDAADSTLLAVLEVRDQSGHTNNKMEGIHKRIIDAITKAKIQVMAQSLVVSEAQDCEALTVVMLQHIQYQSKLFGILRHVLKTNPPGATLSDVARTKESGRKRKKKKDDKKKKSKKKHKKHSKLS